MEKEVKQKWFFKQSPQEVWEYLTQPELLEQWLMKSDIKPVVGHKFRFIHIPKNDGKYEGIVNCEVLEVKPVTKFSYSWKGSTKDGSRTFDSNVVWTLIPKKDGTELQLEHNGFALLEDFTTHNSGWNTCLKRLEGLIIPVQ
jgi:uncharacterized protein YndB with AHSA1/START domain